MRILAAELSKLATLPAVWVISILTPAFAGLVGYLLAEQSAVLGGTLSMVPTLLGYVVIGPVLLGVVAACSEYDSRQIRVSLCATPNRIRLLLGKTVAVATMGGALGLVSSAVGVWSLGALGEPDWLGTTAGATGFQLAMCLLGFAIGFGLRSTTAALPTALVLLVLAPPVLAQLPTIRDWLPSVLVTDALLGASRDLSWATGLGLVAWLVGAWTLAACRLELSDA